MFSPTDPFIRLLAEAGFDPNHWSMQGWVHPNIARLPYWKGREPASAYTSLSIPGRGDHGAVQLEEAAFLYGLVRCFKPRAIVETGCNIGLSASAMALALRDNCDGWLTTCDVEKRWCDATQHRLAMISIPSAVICASGVEAIGADKRVDLFFHDSLHTEANVLAEFNAVKSSIPPGGLAIFHDAHVVWDEGTVQHEMHKTIARIVSENPAWLPILTPSSPGMYILQRAA